MLFKEIIAAYSDNHMQPIKTLCEKNAELKAGGIYTYQYAL
jgi:hypothetical protein